MAAQYNEALSMVEAARLLAAADRRPESTAYLARVERKLVELQSVHAETPAITGEFWDSAIAWRMYYVWGSARVLECKFADARRFFSISHKMNPKFDPSEAMERIIAERGLDKIVETSCEMPSRPSRAARPQPPPFRPPVVVSEREEVVRPEPGGSSSVEPRQPRVAQQTLREQKQRPPQVLKPAPPPAPKPQIAFAPKPCPSLLDALREVVGPGRAAIYAGELLAIGIDLVKTSTLGPWGTALLVGAKLLVMSGQAYEDFNAARRLVAACKD